jgi:hypothetical protein
MMTVLAIIAVTLAIGTWIGFRWADASHRLETDLTAYLASIPADEWRTDLDGWRW